MAYEIIQPTAEEVVERGAVRGIKCLDCGLTSYHPEDVRHRYCGYCHKFHDDDRLQTD